MIGTGPRRTRRYVLRWTVLVVVLVVAGIYLGPRTEAALDSVQQIRHVDWTWLVVALLGELGSLAAFSLVTWVLLAKPGRPKLLRVVRLDLATVALSHAVPAGWAAGTALGYDLLQQEGVDKAHAGVVKVSQSLLSSVLLEVMFSVVLLVQMVLYGPSAANLGLAAAGAVLAAAVVVGCYLLAFRPDPMRRIAQWTLGWLPGLDRDRVGALVGPLSDRMRGLLRRPLALTVASFWSVLNWAFDLLALWAALRAFGHPPDIVLLAIGFCVAQVAASIPISPGGLGVVESSLVPLLIGFGTGFTVAVLGVLCWRLVNYWLPMPIGGIAYLGIVAGRRRQRRRDGDPSAAVGATGERLSVKLPDQSAS